jgi:outer membrane protein OmpA-like peptidoglycan-associated protein
MFRKKSESRWQYSGSSGFSIGKKYVAGAEGTLALTSPDGAMVEFSYASLGLSMGAGREINWSDSRLFPSVGSIYISDKFPGSELTIEDFKGFAVIQEVSAGFGVGGSGTLMLLGIPATRLPMELAKNTGALGALAQLAVDHPMLARLLAGPVGAQVLDAVDYELKEFVEDDAKSALVMAGPNDGFQVQASISNSVGYVWGGKITQPVRVPDPIPGPVTIEVIPKPNGALIHMPGDVLFGFDKWHIQTRRGATSHAEDVLDQVAVYMRANPPRRVRVEGHTDEKGPARYNMDLSIRRAQAVANWLLSKKLVDRANLQIKGFGEEKPTAPNRKPNGSDDPVGRAKNRRVEIWLLK